MVLVFLFALYATLFILAVLKGLGRRKMAKHEPQLWTKDVPVGVDMPLAEAGVFLPKLHRFEVIERRKS